MQNYIDCLALDGIDKRQSARGCEVGAASWWCMQLHLAASWGRSLTVTLPDLLDIGKTLPCDQ
jgi:hypothetical protein